MRNLCFVMIFATQIAASSAALAKPLCAAIFVSRAELPVRSPLLKPSKPLKIEDINYSLQGPKHAPVVILIHGLGGSLESWSFISAALSRDYRVLSYDLRGHGQTEAQGENYHTEVHAQDLRVLLDHLNIQRANIIGHSLGARVGMRFLDMYPDRVLSYVSEDMGLENVQEDNPEKSLKNLHMARLAAGMKPHYSSLEALTDELKDFYDGDLDRANRFAQRISFVSRKTGDVFLDHPEVRLLMGFQANSEDFGLALSRATVPLLFLRANTKMSPFFPSTSIQQINNNAPAAGIVNFPDAGHNIHDDQPRKYLNTVKKFLSKTR